MRISDWSSDVCSSDLILCQNIEGHADILRIDKTDNHLEVFMFKSFLPSAAAAFALLLMSTAASAHTKLVGSTPAANSTVRSEEHTSELQSLMRNSYAVFCLTKKQQTDKHRHDLNLNTRR